MENRFTDEEIKRYLVLLKEIILDARLLARNRTEPEMLHDLLDCAHNLPELISCGTRDKRLYVLPRLKKLKEQYGRDFFKYIPRENIDEW
ncbi:MAG: hypothetical protein ABH845_06160 [Candidatus Omnitrophota bacterium]